MRQALGIALVIALAGCGGGGDTAATAPGNGAQEAQIKVRSPEQDRLHQLSEQDRHIGLKRALRANGTRCQRVTESGYVTEYNNLSMWTATCEDNRKWAIFAGPDGSAQVRPCTEMRQFNLPPCVIAQDGSRPAVNWKAGDQRPEGL